MAKVVSRAVTQSEMKMAMQPGARMLIKPKRLTGRKTGPAKMNPTSMKRRTG